MEAKIMKDEKKITTNDEVLKDKELTLDEVNDVSGGTLKKIHYKKTVDISQNTKNKI